MFKRSSANYSLWPEQARPRRGMSLSLAAGGFAVGIICAIAVVNVASQYIRPMAMEPEPIQDAVAAQPIPVYSGSSTLLAGKPPAAEAEEQSSTHSRPRTVAKVALPTIGRAVPVASETDGRGGDNPTIRTPPVRLTGDSGNPAATAGANPQLIPSDGKAAREDKPGSPEQPPTQVAAREPAPEASAAPQQPAAPAVQSRQARPEPRTRPRARAERSRSRPTHPSGNWAREERQRSYAQPNHVARFREAPVYGSNGAPINSYLPY